MDCLGKRFLLIFLLDLPKARSVLHEVMLNPLLLHRRAVLLFEGLSVIQINWHVQDILHHPCLLLLILPPLILLGLGPSFAHLKIGPSRSLRRQLLLQKRSHVRQLQLR